MTTKKTSIAEMNEVIARFDGYEKVTVTYFGDIDETEWQRKYFKWMNKVGIEYVGDYIVNVEKDKWFKWNDVAYHRDWEWLIPVIKKIPMLVNAQDSLKIRREMTARYKPIENELCNLNKLNAHYCLYQFITWFNQQSKTNDH